MNTPFSLTHLVAAATLALASVAAHAGYVNEAALDKIQPGMSQSDVESALGKGRAVRFASDTGTVWRYTLATGVDDSRGADVYITFGSDGMVTQVQAIDRPESTS